MQKTLRPDRDVRRQKSVQVRIYGMYTQVSITKKNFGFISYKCYIGKQTANYVGRQIGGYTGKLQVNIKASAQKNRGKLTEKSIYTDTNTVSSSFL